MPPIEWGLGHAKRPQVADAGSDRLRRRAVILDTHGDRFVWPSIVYVPAIFLTLAGFFRPAAEPIKGVT